MVEAVILGTGAALGYGIADFLSGVWSRRIGIIAVLVVGQGIGLVALAAVGPVVAPASVSVNDLLWGALAGASAVVGVVLLLRGFQLGRLSVVSPASALAAAGVPVAVDVAVGVEVSTISLVGMGAGLCAIWLICSEQRQPNAPDSNPLAGLPYGLVSGVAFAGMFLALGQSSPESGAWPVISTQAVVAFAAFAVVLWRRKLPSVPLSAVPAVALTGVAGALATLSFLLAARAGILSVAAVVTSLSPAVTVLLAWSWIREPMGPRRVVGLLAAGGALVGMSLG